MKKTALLFLFLLASCGPQNFSHYAMGTFYSFTFYTNPVTAKRYFEICTNELTRLETNYSANLSNTLIWKLNESGFGELNEEALFILESALFYNELSGGAFDMTVRPLFELYGFDDYEYQIPSQEEIRVALEKVGSDHIEISNGSIDLSGGTTIDLGGILKGYAVDRCVTLLTNAGLKSGIVNAGGNLTTIGTKPDAESWRIGIRHPRQSEGIFQVLDVSGDLSFATSGDYERYFLSNGVRYHHLLDPKSGKPASNGVVSVSVAAHSAMDCDALSTSLFIIGLQDGLALCESYSVSASFLVQTNDEILGFSSSDWDALFFE